MVPLAPEDLIKMQLRLECVGFDAADRLIRIPGPDPDDIGRVYAYRHAAGYTLCVRADVSAATYAVLEDLGARAVFEDARGVRRVLAQDETCEDVSHWRTYCLTDPVPELYTGVVTLTEEYRPQMDAYHPGMVLGERPVYAVLVDGSDGIPAIAATCASIRENDEVAETYVFTRPEWRRRGYGRKVTAAWAAGVLSRGKVPLYSHLVSNTPSARLVSSVPAVFCFEGVVYG